MTQQTTSKAKLIIAIAAAVFSAFCTLKAMYSGASAVEVFAATLIVSFLTYLQFQWSDMAFTEKDFKQVFSATGAVILFLLAVSGNTVFWMSSQNADAARLAALERNIKNAAADKATAQNLLSACNPSVVKGCITPRSIELKAKEQVFLAAQAAYNAQEKAITRSESFKIIQSYIDGLDYKTFVFLRALISSFFLEIGVIYCYLSSRSKPHDIYDSRETTAQENFQRQIKSIAVRTDLSEEEKEVFKTWEQFDNEGRTLKNNMPGVMSHFTQAVFGKQGGQYNDRVETILRKLEIVI